MKRKWIISGLVAFLACLTLVSSLPAQDAGHGGTQIGLQAATNFEGPMAGLKIQMRNWAITPKLGFFVQHIKEDDNDQGGGTGFVFGFGSAIDYYIASWREGKLRPYVGSDVLFFIPHVPDNTDFWASVIPHFGVEYWIVDSFSFGGNLGLAFGFGESFYTPTTTGFTLGESDFSFGINGIINMTYYF
ncbi:MAG: hypothetical protein AB1640_02545 [bacterium]